MQNMKLCLRETLRLKPPLRHGIVAALLLALLAFPCGPVATSLASESGHSLAVTESTPAHPEHGEAECAHGAKKHENSCCNDCSSWLASRSDKITAVLSPAPQRDIPAAVPTFAPVLFVGTEQEQRLTGPPRIGFLDGTDIYSRTKRYRI